MGTFIISYPLIHDLAFMLGERPISSTTANRVAALCGMLEATQDTSSDLYANLVWYTDSYRREIPDETKIAADRIRLLLQPDRFRSSLVSRVFQAHATWARVEERAPVLSRLDTMSTIIRQMYSDRTGGSIVLTRDGILHALKRLLEEAEHLKSDQIIPVEVQFVIDLVPSFFRHEEGDVRFAALKTLWAYIPLVRFEQQVDAMIRIVSLFGDNLPHIRILSRGHFCSFVRTLDQDQKKILLTEIDAWAGENEYILRLAQIAVRLMEHNSKS